jgi:hypothetical protein
VDGSFIPANASRLSRIPREQLPEAAQVKRTVREYLADLEQENPVEGAPAKPARSRWCKSTALEGVANHSGPEACAVDREADGEALSGVRIGQPSSRENGSCSER